MDHAVHGVGGVVVRGGVTGLDAAAWSTATSTTTLPSCISLISFSLTSLGALARE